MSSDSLIRLVYVSRRPDPGHDLAQEVRDILIASINNNREAAITGLLLADETWFLQVLEGPRSAVEETYSRIAEDPRHTDATLKLTAEASARQFARWTMCAQTISAADEAMVRRLVKDGDFDPFACDPQTALDLLAAAADIHGQLLTERYAELGGEVLRLD